MGVPTVFDYLTKIKFKKDALKNVKYVVSGGDMISMSSKEKINDFLESHGSKAIIENGYGLTEASGGFTDHAGDFLLTVEFPEQLLKLLPEEKHAAVIGVLSHDPRPSYQREPSRIYGLSFSGFDIRFTVDQKTLTVQSVRKIDGHM